MQNQKKFLEYLRGEYLIGNAEDLRKALNKCMDEIVHISSAITSLCDLRAFCDNRTDESCEGCIFYDEDEGCGIDGLPGNWSVPVIDGKHKEDKPKYWDDWMDRLREKSTLNEPVIPDSYSPFLSNEEGFPTKEDGSPSDSKEMQ